MSGRSYKGRPNVSRAKAASATISRVKAKRSANVSGVRAMGTMASSSGYRPNYGSGSAPEKKALDVDSSGAPVTIQVNTTGAFTLLNGIAVGTGIDQRIGKKIKMDSVYIRGRVAMASAISSPSNASASFAQQVRMIVFYDSQANGTTPTITQVLKAADPASQLNLDNRDRFKILKDKCFTFGNQSYYTATGYGGVGPAIANIKFFKKLNMDVFYGTTSNTAADIQTGGLWLLFVGDFTSGASDCEADITSRLRYTDN